MGRRWLGELSGNSSETATAFSGAGGDGGDGGHIIASFVGEGALVAAGNGGKGGNAGRASARGGAIDAVGQAPRTQARDGKGGGGGRGGSVTVLSLGSKAEARAGEPGQAGRGNKQVADVVGGTSQAGASGNGAAGKAGDLFLGVAMRQSVLRVSRDGTSRVLVAYACSGSSILASRGARVDIAFIEKGVSVAMGDTLEVSAEDRYAGPAMLQEVLGELGRRFEKTAQEIEKLLREELGPERSKKLFGA
jgi:hypothetical protein